ncbi:unnamed protein product [Urochloa decumbens]|uniref:Uncharacterized protein n=1 Tax=Urochloa decumbens TaxID=240449 RepID=A0ABC9HC52_9POAL
MTCSACGCKCGGGSGASEDVAVRREAALAAPLLDLEKKERTTEALSEGDALLKALAERAADRIFKFTIRGLLILLGLYLFACMKRFADMYIGEDTWFSTFAAIVVAVPVAEIFCILGQRMTAPPQK